MKPFKDKVILVTGGANGLGYAIAKRFCDEAGIVVIADIDEEKGVGAAEDLRQAGGQALYLPTDVSKGEAVKALIQEIVQRYNRLDIAINCAALPKDHQPIAELDIEEFDRIIDADLKGVLLSMKYEIRQMLDQDSKGSIINISAVGGVRAQKKIPAHSAAKAGILGATQNAALAYSSQGIRINAITPGTIAAPDYQRTLARYAGARSHTDYFTSMSMLGRPAHVDEVLSAVMWLASDKASYVTGSTLMVDGGFSAK